MKKLNAHLFYYTRCPVCRSSNKEDDRGYSFSIRFSFVTVASDFSNCSENCMCPVMKNHFSKQSLFILVRGFKIVYTSHAFMYASS